jgi:hypothetical protein
MKSTAALVAAAAGAALLSGCSITVQTHSSMESAADRAMAICGLGLIQTSDGPRPAISESPMSPETYQTYTDCVQRLTRKERAGDEKTESASDSGTESIQGNQGPSK